MATTQLTVSSRARIAIARDVGAVTAVEFPGWGGWRASDVVTSTVTACRWIRWPL